MRSPISVLFWPRFCLILGVFCPLGTTRDPQWGPLEGARGLACAPKLHTVGPKPHQRNQRAPKKVPKRATKTSQKDTRSHPDGTHRRRDAGGYRKKPQPLPKKPKRSQKGKVCVPVFWLWAAGVLRLLSPEQGGEWRRMEML